MIKDQVDKGSGCYRMGFILVQVDQDDTCLGCYMIRLVQDKVIQDQIGTGSA